MFMMMMLLLSTASARTLKSDPFLPDSYLGCEGLFICVNGDAVGDKTFAAEYHAKRGGEISPFSFNGKAYCASFTQSLDGLEVYVEFSLDGKLVHKGNYQQNYCFWAAGDIHTNDPNADTFKGSFKGISGFWGGRGDEKPGVVWIKSLE